MRTDGRARRSSFARAAAKASATPRTSGIIPCWRLAKSPTFWWSTATDRALTWRKRVTRRPTRSTLRPTGRRETGSTEAEPRGSTVDRLTGIQIYARVVETGSFSKAARDLNLSQPTITKHVASLEHKLGA